jgi:cytochrome c-type biogenesis protein CcmH
MLVFWIIATLMTLVALAFVLVPLLRTRAAAGPSVAEANLAVLRGQRREIETDVAQGTLPADARDEALAELVERAGNDLSSSASMPVDTTSKPWITAMIAALALPLVAFGTYLAIGTPAAADPRTLARQGGPLDGEQVVALVESLARKVRERPDDAQGWGLLARSMAALGRFKESAEAYERLAKLVPRDAHVLADYADALGMAQGRTLAGRPYELVKEALALDPKHRKALALAGTAALDANDFAAAARYWEALAAELPAGSDDAAQVRNLIAEVRLRATAAGQVLPSSPQESAKPPAPRSVSGSVTVAPEVAAKVAVSDTLFIFARAESGPRMPLAVLRGSARQLPMIFALDDTMAMTPATRLSLAGAVRIEARISRSGNATPQPGDLVGTSDVVRPGARNVKIVVDKVLP